ncbi:MAG: DUF4918 family protein [Bacteroidota bacterium]|nr:DUF4918 family protein [Bacteroidota bacterium]
MISTGNSFYEYITGLDPHLDLPSETYIINPYGNPEVRRVFKKFCDTYYGTSKQRYLILGINSGRFGAGVTGVPFTDPIALSNHCGIENPFQKTHELSSRFVYEMIAATGGVKSFFSNFLLSAVCPLGFLKGKNNYNYYDSPQLLKASSSLIRSSLVAHASWNINTSTVIILGKKNASYLEAFNSELKLFEKVITLEHPRYIMQYKLKTKQDYINRYCDVLCGLL